MKRRSSALASFAALTISLSRCAGTTLPLPPRPDTPVAGLAPAPLSAARGLPTLSPASPPSEPAAPPPAPDTPAAPPSDPVPVEAPVDGGRCASVPPLGPGGAVPPAPPHTPLGQDIQVPSDRPVYVLPGDAADPRVIVYLHGMCGDVTAADYFRDAVKAHGTLFALRGDTPCDNGRFKWRADPSQIQARVRAAFERVNAELGGSLDLRQALLFGYSQGADRAEELAARFPRQYPRVVLGGPPMKASPSKLARATRVAILGGELETTENMRAGVEALQSAGIPCRFTLLECAYHGYFGTRAEEQLADVLDWVSAP